MPHGVLANFGDENGNAMRRVIYLTWDAAEIISRSSSPHLRYIRPHQDIFQFGLVSSRCSDHVSLLPAPSLCHLYFNPSHIHLCRYRTMPWYRLRKPPVAADKPTHNGFTGDVLNVTRCYCVTEDLKQCGYYHQADYSNYHNGRTYQTRYSCADDCGDYWPHGHKHVNKAEPPKCWATGTRKKHKECDTDEEGNKFCHKFYFVPAHIGAPDNAKA